MKRKESTQKKRKRTVFLLLATITICLSAIVLLLPEAIREERAAGVPGGRDPGEPGSAAHQSPASGLAGGISGQRGRLPIKKRPPDVRVRLTVVLDDAGYNLTDLDEVLEFPGALTVAVLPHLPYSREAAERIRDAGKELILHLPMEPKGNADPGPGAITSSHAGEDIRQRLESAFASVPGAQGLNNHMGSKAMEDPLVVAPVMEYLRVNSKFFLDSKTTSQTVAPQLAESYDVPLIERSVFLDNVVTEEAIREQFLRGLDIARRQGSAILVGHVKNPEVMLVLNQMYPLLAGQGVDMMDLATQFDLEEED